MPKFLLGHDKEAAERRRDAIIALWSEIEMRTGSVQHYSGGKDSQTTAGGPFWSPAEEAKAKGIARGEAISVCLSKPTVRSKSNWNITDRGVSSLAT